MNVLGVFDLDPEAVAEVVQVDLAGLSAEPESPIGKFRFNRCTGGVAAFKGRPPWELHRGGDELVVILARRSVLTVLDGEEPTT